MTQGLRERKKLQTRHAIENATIDLVASIGLESVTIEAIAEHADVTSRTFFNHFAGKEEALIGLPRDHETMIAEMPTDQEASSSFELGVALMRAELRDLDTDTFAFDQRRRTILKQYPQLLKREMERFTFMEDATTKYLERELTLRGEFDAAQRFDTARAVTLLVGAAMRLAIERWSRSATGPESLIDSFDASVRIYAELLAGTK